MFLICVKKNNVLNMIYSHKKTSFVKPKSDFNCYIYHILHIKDVTKVYSEKISNAIEN
jgi:hypothetical protein